MKAFADRIKWSSSVFILLFMFNCENQQLTEREIQLEILQDEDFVDMMTNIYLLEYSEHDKGLNESVQIESLETFDSYYKVLDSRHTDFYKNAQAALANKRSTEYNRFCKRLEESIFSLLPSETAKLAVVYNGASICGRESCGNSAQDNTTLGCIAGARFAQEWCIRNNMGNCYEMRDGLIDQCCDSFCNPQ